MSDFVNDSDLYQEIFEKEPSAIIILDERGVVCKVNQSALDMLGVESLIGRKWYQVIGEELFFELDRVRSHDLCHQCGCVPLPFP